MAEQHIGKVVEITGPVLVAAFEGGHLPPIYNALHIISEGFDVPQPIDVIAEVEQHFRIKFSLREIMRFQNVGDMCTILRTKLGS